MLLVGLIDIPAILLGVIDVLAENSSVMHELLGNTTDVYTGS